MADPATPTIQDRAETLAVARQWLDAVREDRPVRVDIRAIYGDTNGFVTALCQEVTLLAEQLAEVRAAKEEACDLATAAIGQIECGYDEGQASNIYSAEQHIAALRKVGA